MCIPFMKKNAWIKASSFHFCLFVFLPISPRNSECTIITICITALCYKFIGAFHFSSYVTRSFITFHTTVYVTTKRIKCTIHNDTHSFYLKYISYDLQLNIYKEKGPRVLSGFKTLWQTYGNETYSNSALS